LSASLLIRLGGVAVPTGAAPEILVAIPPFLTGSAKCGINADVTMPTTSSKIMATIERRRSRVRSDSGSG